MLRRDIFCAAMLIHYTQRYWLLCCVDGLKAGIRIHRRDKSESIVSILVFGRASAILGRILLILTLECLIFEQNWRKRLMLWFPPYSLSILAIESGHNGNVYRLSLVYLHTRKHNKCKKKCRVKRVRKTPTFANIPINAECVRQITVIERAIW